MKKKKFIHLFLIILSAVNTINQVDAESLKFRLAFDKSSYIKDQPIICFLDIENVSSTAINISLPKKPIFSIQGPSIQDSFQFIPIRDRNNSLENNSLFLRPKNTVRYYLGKAFIKNLKREGLVPTGSYTVTVNINEFTTSESLLKEVKAVAEINIQEYPLIINIVPDLINPQTSKLKINITNDGIIPIQLFNLFVPFKDFFDLTINKKSSQLQDTIQEVENPTIKTLYSLPKSESWINLLPGESISTEVDIKDRIKKPGNYVITITYVRKIILFFTNEKPKYTSQARWISNSIAIKQE